MQRERGNRQRTADVHRVELASVQAQAERRSGIAWEKGCKQLQKQVGDLQKEHARGVLDSIRRDKEWEEREKTHRLALQQLGDETNVRRLLCLYCCSLLFIL